MAAPALDNRTEFTAHPQVLLDKDGEKLAVIVKATFEAPFDGRGPLYLAPKSRRRIIRMADVPWDPDKPDKSSVMFPSDACLRKPGTDVIVIATAYAPEGKPAATFETLVKVGPLSKMLTVHGLRVWEDGGAAISAPRPITDLALRYENAWGGVDDSDPAKFVEEARNPVGMGMTRDPKSLSLQRAPQIEDPLHPIASHRTRPPPAGYGPIGRHWAPRRQYAGTHDEDWLDQRAPLPPLDQDDRFFQCASPGLTAIPFLRGDESIATMNLIRGGGPLTLELPRVGVEIEFRVKDREPVHVLPPLDTLIVDLFGIGPAVPIGVELVWRAYVKAPRRLKDAKVVVRARELAS